MNSWWDEPDGNGRGVIHKPAPSRFPVSLQVLDLFGERLAGREKSLQLGDNELKHRSRLLRELDRRLLGQAMEALTVDVV